MTEYNTYKYDCEFFHVYREDGVFSVTSGPLALASVLKHLGVSENSVQPVWLASITQITALIKKVEDSFIHSFNGLLKFY